MFNSHCSSFYVHSSSVFEGRELEVGGRSSEVHCKAFPLHLKLIWSCPALCRPLGEHQPSHLRNYYCLWKWTVQDSSDYTEFQEFKLWDRVKGVGLFLTGKATPEQFIWNFEIYEKAVNYGISDQEGSIRKKTESVNNIYWTSTVSRTLLKRC